MYAAKYHRHRHEPRIEVCALTHAGRLPAPWLATGFVVNLVTEGAADLRSGGRTYSVQPGHVVLANPGQIREITHRHTPTASTRSLIFDEDYLRDAFQSRGLAGGPGYFDQFTSTNRTLQGALLAFHRSLSLLETRLTLETALESLLEQLARVMVKAEPPRWPAHPAVRRAREYIESNSERELGLAELCSVAGLSRAHFIREFRRQAGIAPHQYQIHTRVRRARALLNQGASVASAAAEAGFCDQAHLARHFRRLIGVSAADYRQATIREHFRTS